MIEAIDIFSSIGIILLFLIFLVLIYWRFIFLRDPKRRIPQGKVLVSPADGKIISVMKVDAKNELKIPKGLYGKIRTLTSDVAPSCFVISIFMNVFNVHVNRTPFDGKIVSVKHMRGKFFPADTARAGVENEKSEILIKTKIGTMKVIQIAGLLARRIETWVKPGQEIKKGERIGRINLGSQVTLIVSSKIKPAVKVGDKVKAGSSIIAKF